MSDMWVLNASPVIALAKANSLFILAESNRDLIIPDAVAEEIRQGPTQDPARQALESGWGPKPAVSKLEYDVLEWGLGPGESAVLSLARQKTAWAVVDDRAARNACKALGIRFIGTLGVILLAKVEGRISSSVAVLKTLQNAGLYLDDEMIRTGLLKSTGEIWPV